MKHIIMVLIVLLAAAAAHAGPFLVCDPPPADQHIIQYEVYQDGVSLGVVDAQPDGSLQFDLTGTAPGSYGWTAVAINAWGRSEPSNPYASPAAAGAPSNMRLTP